MVSALDDAIGNVTQSLKDHGLYDDTLIIFSADVSINMVYSTFVVDILNNFSMRWFF